MRHRPRPSSEPTIVCFICETRISETEILDHLRDARCRQPDPHPLGKWIARKEALEMGATSSILSHRLMRTRGATDDKQYLLRDVVRLVALRISGEKLRAAAAARRD
jgi:hypothetical protein